MSTCVSHVLPEFLAMQDALHKISIKSSECDETVHRWAAARIHEAALSKQELEQEIRLARIAKEKEEQKRIDGLEREALQKAQDILSESGLPLNSLAMEKCREAIDTAAAERRRSTSLSENCYKNVIDAFLGMYNEYRQLCSLISSMSSQFFEHEIPEPSREEAAVKSAFATGKWKRFITADGCPRLREGYTWIQTADKIRLEQQAKFETAKTAAATAAATAAHLCEDEAVDESEPLLVEAASADISTAGEYKEVCEGVVMRFEYVLESIRSQQWLFRLEQKAKAFGEGISRRDPHDETSSRSILNRLAACEKGITELSKKRLSSASSTFAEELPRLLPLIIQTSARVKDLVVDTSSSGESDCVLFVLVRCLTCIVQSSCHAQSEAVSTAMALLLRPLMTALGPALAATAAKMLSSLLYRECKWCAPNFSESHLRELSVAIAQGSSSSRGQTDRACFSFYAACSAVLPEDTNGFSAWTWLVRALKQMHALASALQSPQFGDKSIVSTLLDLVSERVIIYLRWNGESLKIAKGANVLEELLSVCLEGEKQFLCFRAVRETLRDILQREKCTVDVPHHVLSAIASIS